MMRKTFWLSVMLAALAAFFASKFPDGLDLISGKLGFAHKAAQSTSLLAGYSMPFVSGSISTALAGIAGILIILCLSYLTALILKKFSNGTNK